MLVFGGEFGIQKDFILDENVLKFSKSNLEAKPEGMLVDSVFEGVIANLHKIEFILCENLGLAVKLQKVADDYLFDSKIAFVADEDSIELFDQVLNARIDVLILYLVKGKN